MILFLDFDGVLHPEDAPAAGLFCCSPVLWRVLRARPEVDVVFSTSWREIKSLKEMIVLSTRNEGSDLGHRFVGQTPVIPLARYREHSHPREEECFRWLSENSRTESPWLALDDLARLFSPGCRNLYRVNHRTGLTDADIPAILERLR